jgi:2-polyprenyl-3-methyl-5-hydroxy-6-metoxy-1,4-benzoquinol methylase
MEEYFKSNLKLWNELTPIHAQSDLYDMEGFKQGKSTLESIELEEAGDVCGKSLLHLQCHFGMDTLSWARLGANVTGVDFSDEAINLARSLSKETGIKANFICADIYKLPDVMHKKFDIVFTSRGVLCWLPDLEKWAKLISHFLKPGGTFYIIENHPFMMVFDNSTNAAGLKVSNSYFHKTQPVRWEPEGDYTDRNAMVMNPSYEWMHSLSDVMNALIGAGLRIEFLHEFPYINYQHFPFMEEVKPGQWRIKGIDMPLAFSLKAAKVP